MGKKREYQTKSRKKILEYLQLKKDQCVTISDIKEFLMQQEEEVNVSTIYRFLDKLIAQGKVMKYQKEDGKKAVFQYIDDMKEKHCHEHLHMQCVKCGKVIHLNCEFMEDFSKHMKEHHHFQIQCPNSILYGICEDCEGKVEERKEEARKKEEKI